MLDFLFNKNYQLIVEEKDLTIVLDTIDRHSANAKYELGNCRWPDRPHKWYIRFSVSEKVYGRIMNELLGHGSFQVSVRKDGVVDLNFERGV